MTDKTLLTIEETAHTLGVGRTTLYALFKSKQLKPVKIGTATRVPVDEVANFVERLRGGVDVFGMTPLAEVIA